MKSKCLLLALTAVMLVSLFSCVTGGNAASSETEKLVALTFDDGPDAVLTPLILDKLEKYDVPATFFVVGQLVNESTLPVIERTIALGCEVGNHSWEWQSMDQLSAEQVRESVDMTTAAIEEYYGMTPAFFRPPNLAVGGAMWDTIEYPFASGILGFDWAGTGTTAEDRADNILGSVEDGAIILLHDVQPQPHPTPEALDIIIPELLSQGYEFVTLSELFERKGVNPEQEGVMWVYVQ